MTEVFNLFAFKSADDPDHDVRRDRLPIGRLTDAIRWATAKGCDTVLLQVVDAAPSCDSVVTHHTCTDPACPGGC